MFLNGGAANTIRWQIFFQKCLKLRNNNREIAFDIAYFITSDVSPEERFLIQKQYDTEKDYTFYKSDDELREGAAYIVEQSLLMKEQCEKYGLPFYETAKERDQAFQRFLRDFHFD